MHLSLNRRWSTERMPEVDVDVIARSIALDAADAGLRHLQHRRRLTHDEAVLIVGELRRNVDELVLGDEVAQALDTAALTVGEDHTVDAGRVVDAVLDVRLAVARTGS
jgi:hypothetical protein